MEHEGIPNHVKGFIAEHVGSLIVLEMLLLLQKEPSREWSGVEASQALRAAPEWAERELRNLVRRGIADQVEGPIIRFRYAPRTPELDQAVKWLSSHYPELRFSIIQLIFAAPSDTIKSFADAFKLRKDEPRG